MHRHTASGDGLVSRPRKFVGGMKLDLCESVILKRGEGGRVLRSTDFHVRLSRRGDDVK
jgi:hypothetical protein